MASNSENLKAIVAKLDTLGYPIAWGNFNKEQVFPYLVYLEEAPQNMGADNSSYIKVRNYRIEYYFTELEPAKEEAVEQAISELDSNYSSSGATYIESDTCYVNYYYIQL